MKIRLLIFPLTALLVISVAGSQNPAASTIGSPAADTLFFSAKVPAQVPLAAAPFSLTQVRLLDGPFKQAMERDLKYMLSLDNDRLLH